MNEKVKEFMEALQADKKLEGALKEALEGIEPKEQKAAIVKFAKEKGFDLSEANLNPDGQEVSLDELDNVAGGRGGGCSCLVAGGGDGTDSNDGKTYGCACVAYGQGGDGGATDANCFCPLVGEGANDTQYF